MAGNISLNNNLPAVVEILSAAVAPEVKKNFRFVHKLFPEMLDKTINLYEIASVIIDQLNEVQK